MSPNRVMSDLDAPRLYWSRAMAEPTGDPLNGVIALTHDGLRLLSREHRSWHVIGWELPRDAQRYGDAEGSS